MRLLVGLDAASARRARRRAAARPQCDLVHDRRREWRRCSAMPRARPSPGRRGARSIDASEIRLQENLDPTRRIVERTVTRLDGDGRPVSISDSSQMGPDWSRVEARIGADVAEIVRQALGRAAAAAAARCRRASASTAARGCSPAGTRRRRRGSNSRISTSARWSWSGSRSRPCPARRPMRRGGSRCCASATRAPSCAPWPGCCSTASAASSRSPSRCSAPASPRASTDRETALAPHRPYSLLHSAMMRSPFRMSDDCGARPYPLPLRLQGRDRVRAAADRRAEGDGAAGRGRRRHLPLMRAGPRHRPGDARRRAAADALAAERPSAPARHRRAGRAAGRSTTPARWRCCSSGRGPICSTSISPAISRRWRR